MKYNISITGFKNDFGKKTIARQLANDPAISLQKALEIVENPPFLFLKNLSAADLKRVCIQQKQYGTDLQVEKCTEKSQPLVIPLNQSNMTPCVTNGSQLTPETKTHTASKKNHTRVASPMVEAKTWYLFTFLPKRFFLIIFTALSLGLLLWCYHNFPGSNIHPPRYINPVQRQNQDLLPATADKIVKQKFGNHQRDRFSTSANQRKRSILYLDSANRRSPIGLRKKITFFKIALSFNKYNFSAWQGLLTAYKKAGMLRQKQETAKKMLDLFGPAVFSLLPQNSTLGVIEDAFLTSDKTYRILYTTKTISKQALIAETYQLLKTIKTSCACEHISLFASHKKGKGIHVYLDTHKPFVSLQDYSQTAQITFFD